MKNYQFAHLNKAQIKGAARKALMTVEPLYYSWPEDRKVRFRARMNEQQRARVDQVLLESLLNIQCPLDKTGEVWNDVPLDQLNILNWASILTRGIGQDSIYLNEFMARDTSLLDFSTLYDYDYKDYLFQEEARLSEDPTYKGSEYFAWKHSSWVRLLIDDNFFYANFTSLATYFLDEVEQVGNEYIGQLIPHQYVDGKDNGKPVSDDQDKGIIWDFRTDANGFEDQLDELKSRWYKYCHDKWFELSKDFNSATPAVYMLDEEGAADPNRTFIFNNAAVIKSIHWKSFITDCSHYLSELSSYETHLEQEIDASQCWLDKNYQDIIKNFDPKVAKLKKKRRIVLSNQAIEDIHKLSSDSELPD